VAKKNKTPAVDYAKQQSLLTMYASVERMNQHIIDGNTDGVTSEQHLQRNLRNNFRELQERQDIHTDL